MLPSTRYLFGTGVPSWVTKQKRRERSAPRSSRNVRLHEGRVKQPGVPAPSPRGPRLPGPPPPTLASLHSLLKLPTTGPVATPTPEVALMNALTHGIAPPRSLEREYGRKAFQRAELARIHYLSQQEGLKEPDDLTNAILLASGAGEIASLGRTIGEVGIKEALGGAAAREAASSAESTGVKAALRAAAKRAAQKAEPEAVRATRQAASEAIPQSVKTAARVAAKGASYPVRHPVQAPFSAQVPFALAHGNPKELVKPLEGTGVYANVVGALANKVGGVPGEAISLPATVLPTAFLTGKAAVNAAQGNGSELSHLLDAYRKTGLLPALVEGNLGEAAHRLGEHPLYGGLEASGALSALGRGLGAGARALPGEFGSLDRADLPVGATGLVRERGYSRDLIRQLGQRAFDRTQFGQRVKPSTLRARRIQKEAANRFSSNAEARRRQMNHELDKSLADILPRRGPVVHFKGRNRGKLDRRGAEIVSLAVERLIQHPQTFHEDLPFYRHLIEDAAKERSLGPEQLRRHRALIDQIKRAEKIDDPHRIHNVINAANAFIDLQQPILEEMQKLKLLTPAQSRMARLVSFARVHMGAGWKEDGLVDKEGQPLHAEQIEAEMARRGVEPPGFISHQPPKPGDYFQPHYGGAMLPKGTRTGEAAVTGTALHGIEALTRQLRRSSGLVHRAKTWNAAVTEFGHVVRGVKKFADAWKVKENPEKYGLDPNEQWVTVPLHPFQAKKHEREGALENQSPAMALLEQGGDTSYSHDHAGEILADSLKAGEKEELAPGTEVAFMPKKIAEEFRKDAEPSNTGLKAGQAATNVFKRAVLPFSPSFYIGNGFDNYMRTFLAGINPAHFLVGSKVARKLSEETKAELLGGALYSSVDRMAPHRSIESIVKGEDLASKAARRMAEWSHRHGAKQAAAKFLPSLMSGASHFLLSTNALLTERLPQYGALGKVALADMRETQGSWAKAIRHFDEASTEFAKGAPKLSTMTRLQKDLEEVYGNYSRMSPGARKTLSTFVPFWTWMRAAYKFVYVTMPAHHPIQTGLLTAARRANQAHLEAFGLDPEGAKPVEDYLRGGIPIDATGGIVPTANYNSFGYAASPSEAGERAVAPQIAAVREGLGGRNAFGEPLPGSPSEADKVLAATLGLVRAAIPGMNLVLDEEKGKTVIKPHVPLPHEYDAEKVAQARIKRQTISVPVKGETTGSSASSTGVDYGSVFSGSASSSVNYASVFGGQ